MQLTLVHKKEGYRLTVEVEEGVDTAADFEAVVLDPTGNMHVIVRRDAFEIETPAAAPALTLPADGSTIIFDRVTTGSYARAGEAYRVQVRGAGRWAYVHLTNAARGSGTFDRGWAYAGAAFRVVEAGA